MKKLLPLLVFTLFFTSSFITAQNNALTFSSDYILINSNMGLGTTNITGECWVNLPSTSESGTFINIGGDQNGYAIGVGSGNFESPGNELILIYDNVLWFPTGINIGTGWHHVAFTVDGVGSARAFLDGQLVYFWVGTPIAPSNFTVIGASDISGGRPLTNGTIDEVRIWNVPLGDLNIRANMYKELVGNEANLVAYYKFNETSGQALNDGTSNNYVGALSTGINFTDHGFPSPAFFGPKNCLNFDGDDWVSLPNTLYNNNFSNGSAITIEYWFKGTQLQSPVRFQDPSDNYVVAGWGGTAPQFIISTDGYTNGLEIYPSGESILEDDNWHHIALSWKKNTTNGFKAYVDGVLTNQKNSANVNLPAIDYVGLLGAFNGPLETMIGSLDEVRIWNDIRTESEIRENMFKSLVGDESNLVGYYNMDNTGGTTAQSYPTTAYDGTLGGNPTWVASTAFNTWLNTNSSDLAIASNWSNGIPATTDNVGVNNYSGTSPIIVGDPTVNNLFIGSGSGITLNSGFTVNGNLFLNDNLDLNGQTITLGSTATLFEDNGLISGSTGNITTTRNLNNINENVAGLGATITTSADMGSTVITRGHTVYVTEGRNSIKRYFDITPTNNSGLNATLTFNYDDSELNGLTELNLLLFKSTDGGTIWTNESGTINTTNNTISLSAIDGFSRWTAAEDLVLSLENNIIKGFNLFPNPTNGLLFINAEEEIKQVKVFNLLGQQLVEKSINAKEAILDVKKLSTGSYYLLIKTNETVKSVKFIIE